MTFQLIDSGRIDVEDGRLLGMSFPTVPGADAARKDSVFLGTGHHADARWHLAAAAIHWRWGGGEEPS